MSFAVLAMVGCAVESTDEAGASVTASGCYTIGSGGYKGGIVCTGVGECGTHTGQSFWGTEVISNGPKNATGIACCADGTSCNGVKADTNRAFECTDYVMRHFKAMGSQYDITQRAYTGTMCNVYGSNSNFNVYEEGSVPQPTAGDVIVFSEHTVVVSSYDPNTSKVWFYQQNATWPDLQTKTQMLVKDHTTYANGSVAGRYNYSVRCLIRAKNVCETVGSKTASGCSGEDVKTCESNHQWSACLASSSGSSCKSSTLAAEVPDGTCLQSAKDENWYHCDNGNWVAGESSCTSTYAWCHSSTLGESVPPRTCVQSNYDDVWYQCAENGWETGVSNGAGPLGVCSSQYPL